MLGAATVSLPENALTTVPILLSAVSGALRDEKGYRTLSLMSRPQSSIAHEWCDSQEGCAKTISLSTKWVHVNMLWGHPSWLSLGAFS